MNALSEDDVNNELRILIIDDNPDIHKDFIDILTSHQNENNNLEEMSDILFDEKSSKTKTQAVLPSFHIDTATQGQEGYERIVASIKEDKPYALAFVDIRMPPGWDGIETIKNIWQVDPNIQIVICTAYSDYSWEETVAALGEKENLLIIKKPFDYVAVRQLSLALTKKWQLLKETQKYTKELENMIQERTKSLQQSLSISRGTLESSMDGIIVFNNNNEVIDYNTKIMDLWHLPNNIVKGGKGDSFFDFVAERLYDKENFFQILKDLQISPNKKLLRTLKDKENRVIEYYTQPYNIDRVIEGRIWSFRDVTEKQQMEEKIHFQATHDNLTQLPNRQLMYEFISQQILKSSREHSKFAIAFVDLDRFKLINDSFNHSVGDELLVQIANRFKENLRKSDLLARIGGDEFLYVISDFESMSALKTISNKLLDIFKEPFRLASRDIIISPSIGMSIYPENGNTVDELVTNADTAMYRAKDMGGTQIKYYDDKLNKESLLKVEIESELRHAIKNDELFLCYQPQLDYNTKNIISIEALVRWNHPKKGVLLPIDFIPLALETGISAAVTSWVLRKACAQSVIWQKMGLPKIRIAVNITTQEFKQDNFVLMVKSILEETSLEPKYLELELTENIILTDVDAANKISELKKLGITIAVDDFGTGYSSLNYLRTIPVDRLKIDKSFIDNINLKRGDEVIIQAIITMAKNLNLEIMAEGVETKKQLDFLLERNCNSIQGYYYSKPLVDKDIETLLQNTKKESKD